MIRLFVRLMIVASVAGVCVYAMPALAMVTNTPQSGEKKTGQGAPHIVIKQSLEKNHGTRWATYVTIQSTYGK